MKRAFVRITGTVAAAAAIVALVAAPAEAHTVLLDVEATSALVPVPPGDADGEVTAVVSFNSEQSPEVCIEGTATNLDEIVGVLIIAREGESTLLEFTDGTLESCVVSTDEQRHELHDFAADYLLLVTTDEFPEGAVAGELIEQEPTTTTSSTVPEESPSSTAAAAAAAASTSPRFTG